MHLWAFFIMRIQNTFHILNLNKENYMATQYKFSEELKKELLLHINKYELFKKEAYDDKVGNAGKGAFTIGAGLKIDTKAEISIYAKDMKLGETPFVVPNNWDELSNKDKKSALEGYTIDKKDSNKWIMKMMHNNVSSVIDKVGGVESWNKGSISQQVSAMDIPYVMGLGLYKKTFIKFGVAWKKEDWVKAAEHSRIGTSLGGGSSKMRFHSDRVKKNFLNIVNGDYAKLTTYVKSLPEDDAYKDYLIRSGLYDRTLRDLNIEEKKWKLENMI